jgi:hypothetical protein
MVVLNDFQVLAAEEDGKGDIATKEIAEKRKRDQVLGNAQRYFLLN